MQLGTEVAPRAKLYTCSHGQSTFQPWGGGGEHYGLIQHTTITQSVHTRENDSHPSTLGLGITITRNRLLLREHQNNPLRYTVKAIILTRRIYNDLPKLTSLRVPKVTIRTHSQRSIGQYMCRFLYNNFYFNNRFLLVNSLELALRYI